jgi:hypothetical protein
VATVQWLTSKNVKFWTLKRCNFSCIRDLEAYFFGSEIRYPCQSFQVFITVHRQEHVLLKGTVARDFWPLVFFSWIDPIWAPNSYPKTFPNSGSNSRRYSNFKVVLRDIRPRGTQKKILDRGLFKHWSHMPWVVLFIDADDFRKVSL